MLASLAERLIKRVADDPQEIQHLPPWAILIFLIDFIAFVPLVIWVCDSPRLISKLWHLPALPYDLVY